MAVQGLGKLLKLQELDMRLRDLELRLTLLPGELKKILAQRDEVLKSTADSAAKVKKIELAIRNAENETAQLADNSRKLQQQSALVKKNTEYQAMLATIADNKRKTEKIEEEMIGLLDELEPARAAHREFKAANDAKINALRDEFNELVDFSKTVKAEIAKLKEERPDRVRGIEPDNLNRYNFLLGRKRGSAPLAPAENGICGGCHMRLTAQTLNELQKNGLTTCDNCQGMLYNPAAVEE